MPTIFYNTYFLYGLSVLASLILYLCFYKKLGTKPYFVPFLCFIVHFTGLVLSILFGKLESGFDKGVFGSLFGSVLLSPVAGILIAKLFRIKYGALMDFATVSFCFSAAVMRINCINAGCCMGNYIHQYGTARYPVREIEIVFYIIFIIVSVFIIAKDKNFGQLYPLLLITYGTLRFVLNFMRYGYRNTFVLPHIWALLAIISGIAWLSVLLKSKYKGQ